MKKWDQFPERLSFFLAPRFSGWIPIWSMDAIPRRPSYSASFSTHSLYISVIKYVFFQRRWLRLHLRITLDPPGLDPSTFSFYFLNQVQCIVFELYYLILPYMCRSHLKVKVTLFNTFKNKRHSELSIAFATDYHLNSWAWHIGISQFSKMCYIPQGCHFIFTVMFMYKLFSICRNISLLLYLVPF